MPESGAAGDLQRQRRSLENPDPQSSTREGVNKTLFSDTLESRYFFNVHYTFNDTDINLSFHIVRLVKCDRHVSN